MTFEECHQVLQIFVFLSYRCIDFHIIKNREEVGLTTSMTFSSLKSTFMTLDSLSIMVYFMISKNSRKESKSSRSSQLCSSTSTSVVQLPYQICYHYSRSLLVYGLDSQDLEFVLMLQPWHSAERADN